MRSILKIFLTIIILFVIGYLFRDKLIIYLRQPIREFVPCSLPITYSLGSFDERFGLTKDEFQITIRQAEQIWEKPIGKNLFNQTVNGEMKINLIYDDRQASTEILKKIGIDIDENTESYDNLKSKYKSLVAIYERQKAIYDKLIAEYEAGKTAYEKDVNYWNARGGAPQNEFKKLEQEKNKLNSDVSEINQAKNELNQSAANINAVANGINRLIKDLNLRVENYNTIGDQRGREFEEGEFVSDAAGERINIYEFNSQPQLARVMAHELGHALGLEHVDSEESVMYRINQGKDLELSPADLAELKKLCRVE